MGWHLVNMTIGKCEKCGNLGYHARTCTHYRKDWEDHPSCPWYEERQGWIRQAQAFDDCWRD